MVRIVFWISIGVLLTACSNAAVLPSPEALAPTGNNVSEPITMVTSTPVTLISELTATTTYTVPDLGYAFDYPVAWTISALPDVPKSAVTIHSWEPAMATGDRPQSDGIPEGGEKLDIIPLSMFDVDYDEALPWFREQNEGNSFTEENVTLPSGAPGILFVFEQNEDVGSRCLLAEVNHTAILACGLAWKFQYFESIAFSLHPAQ